MMMHPSLLPQKHHECHHWVECWWVVGDVGVLRHLGEGMGMISSDGLFVGDIGIFASCLHGVDFFRFLVGH